MRNFYSGSGDYSNTHQTAVRSYLAAHRQLTIANLIIINPAPSYKGEYLGSPILLTDYPSPLKWDYKGTFNPAVVNVGSIASKTGLEAVTVDLTWKQINGTLAINNGIVLQTIVQGFHNGIFDNGEVEIWRCLMPTIGDCNTLGACMMFGGRIGNLKYDRTSVTMTIVSRMEALNIQVPPNLIEPGNIFAQYSVGAKASSNVYEFTVAAGSTTSIIYAYSSTGGITPANAPEATTSDGFAWALSGRTLTGFNSFLGMHTYYTFQYTVSNQDVYAFTSGVDLGLFLLVDNTGSITYAPTAPAPSINTLISPSNTFDNGYVVMGHGTLLGGTYRRVNTQILQNGYQIFYLTEPLPFLPNAGDGFCAYVPQPIGYSLLPFNSIFPAHQRVPDGSWWTFQLNSSTLTGKPDDSSSPLRTFGFIYHDAYSDVYHRTSDNPGSTGDLDYPVVLPSGQVTFPGWSDHSIPPHLEPDLGLAQQKDVLGFPYVPIPINSNIGL